MMNISLSSAAEKQKQKKAKLSFGLNTSAPSKKSNVFGDNDEDDDDDNEESGRDQVNRDLLREQEALRRRASSALNSYDFDGTYVETSKVGEAPASTKRESRYIADMMKKAVKRNYERDIALERKVAKEQAAEEADFLGKEKFVTSAYKKKLAERELWKQEEEEQSRRDEKEDVTKRKDGLIGFYSNFNKNASMGGTEVTKQAHDRQHVDEPSQPSFLDGFEPAGDCNDVETSPGRTTSKPSFLDGFEASSINADDRAKDNEEEKGVTPSSASSLQQRRCDKIAKARLRYFQRRGITEQEALQERY
jgi:coiled-coil domain-containing protein 55